jgi:hypothetical protein
VPQDSNGVARPATGSLTVSDYAKIYVANIETNRFCVVPKMTPAAGTSEDVTVTVAGKDAYGVDIAPSVLTFTLQGPDPAPGASQLVITELGLIQTSTPPPDPGTASVPL